MPSPLSSADLTEIWEAFTEVFPSTVDIQRQDLTDKLSRGPWNTSSASTPCWFISAGSSLPVLIASMLSGGTLKQANAERCVFTGEVDVKVGDTLIKEGGSTRYAVRGIQRDDLQIAVIADVEAMKVERT